MDGDSHKIQNLRIRADDDGGKYGLVSENRAKIKRLFVFDAVIVGERSTIEPWTYVGIIAGINYGTITLCNVTGSIDVDKSYSDVGGIVGMNEIGGMLHLCFVGDYDLSRTTIIASGDVGGVAGANYGNILLCATGNALIAGNCVGQDRSIGGVVGYGNNCYVMGCPIGNIEVRNISKTAVGINRSIGLVVGYLQDSTLTYTIKDDKCVATVGVMSNYKYCFNGVDKAYGRLANCSLSNESGITDPV